MGYGFEDEEEDEFSLENYLGDMGIGIQDPLQTEMPEVNMSFDYGAAYEDPSTNFTQYHSPVQAEDLYDPNWSVDTVDIGGPLDSVLPSQGGYLSVPSSISSPFARIYKDQLLQSETRQSELELQKEALRDNLLNMGKWGWEDRVGQIGSMLLPFFASYATGGGGNEDRRLGEAFSAASTGSELFLKDAEGRRKGEASLLAQELQNVQGELKGEDALQRQLSLKPLELEAQLQVAEARRPRGRTALGPLAKGQVLASSPEATRTLLDNFPDWKNLTANQQQAILSNPAALEDWASRANQARKSIYERGGDDPAAIRGIADEVRSYAPGTAATIEKMPTVLDARSFKEEKRRDLQNMANLAGTAQKALPATFSKEIIEQQVVIPKISQFRELINRLYTVDAETPMGRLAASKIRSHIPTDDLSILRNWAEYMSSENAVAIFGSGTGLSNKEGDIIRKILASDEMLATGDIKEVLDSLEFKAVDRALNAIAINSSSANYRNGAEAAAAMFIMNMPEVRREEILGRMQAKAPIFGSDATLADVYRVMDKYAGRDLIQATNPFASTGSMGGESDVRRPVPMTEKPREDPGAGMVWALNRKGEWVAAPLSKVRRAN